MNLHGIESRLSGKTHGVTILPCHIDDLVPFHSPHERGRINIETAGRGERHTTTYRAMGHIPAMPHLNRCRSSLGVDIIGYTPQTGNDFPPQP